MIRSSKQILINPSLKNIVDRYVRYHNYINNTKRTVHFYNTTEININSSKSLLISMASPTNKFITRSANV